MSFRIRILILLFALLALLPTAEGADSGVPLRMLPGSGFCANGVYGIMRWPDGKQPDGLQIWGSFCDKGDNNVGRSESQEFLAPAALNFYLAGYPGMPGRRLLLKNLQSGKEMEITPSPEPREDWRFNHLLLPSAWLGQRVQLIAEDQATGLSGWLGFSLPLVEESLLSTLAIDTGAPQGGFCPDGAYGATEWPAGEPPKGIHTWGSYCKSGDAGTGWIALPPFHAGSDLRLYLAGYPSGPGLSLGVENMQNGWQFPLGLHMAPGEAWQVHDFQLPAGWKGQPVRLIARDQATGLRGWLAFSEPIPETLSDRTLGAAKTLWLILLLAVALLLPAVVACIGMVMLGVERMLYLAATAVLILGFSFWFYSRLWYPLDGIVSGCAALLAGAAVVICFRLAGSRGLNQLRAAMPAMLDIRRRRQIVLILIWGLAAIAIMPAVFRWPAPGPYTGSDLLLRMCVGYLVAFAICGWIFRRESGQLSRSQTISLVFVVLLLTSIVNNIHSFNVDQVTRIFPDPNRVWQKNMQDLSMQLSPAVLPHSYRFLPNSIVRWMQLAHIDFESARDLYRLLAGLLLFYAIYKYARLYVNYTGAMIAMLLVAAIYPISFEYYAGQLTDPLSHLSFVLAFIFLETEEFALLLTTLVIGALAKETVLAMAGYYLLFCRQERRYRLQAAALCVVSVAVYFGVRLYVLHGSMNYNQTSGVTLEHVVTNWRSGGIGDWHAPFLLTACALLPFLALNWKQTPRSLKRQVFFLFPVLFISSLFFSWLHEARNYMPLVFVLAVVAANYFTPQSGDPLPKIDSERKETAVLGD